MRLQTLQAGAGGEPTVLAETPWHDDASAVGGPRRERLKQYLAGFFEAEGDTMQAKPELLGDGKNPVPDAVRLVDENGSVLDSYDFRDLQRDTGLRIIPVSADQPGGD